MLGQELAQHRDEDIDRVGRTSLRVSEEAAFGRAHGRVEGAIHLRAAVDQIEHKVFTISLAVMRIGRPVRRSHAARAVRTGGSRRRTLRRALRLGVPLVVLGMLSGSCSGAGLFRQYEYEEEMYLSLDGSATVYVNSSIAA